MNILSASYRYLDEIMRENCGVKAIITDDETLTTISLAMTRTELFYQDVIDTKELKEIINKPVNPIVSSLKCICILRPTRENIETLSTELSTAPHYSRYSLYFTNTIYESQIGQLAKFDKFHLVDHVEEVYLDYYPLNHKLFSLNYASVSELRMNPSADLFISRLTDSVFAVLCALQLRPAVRYSRQSNLCQTFGRSIAERISKSNFDEKNEPSLLLILDRMSDPLTPLLHPWFYSGAVHELFGLKNNLVSIPSRNEPIVFDERHDTFIRDYGCSFLADVGPAVAQRTSEAKRLNQSAKQQIRTPEQIADVVHAASQFQEQFRMVGNHLAIVDAINAQVSSSSLIRIGELEQAMATSDDPQGHLQEILKLGEDSTKDEMIRLLLIYALRYQGRAVEQINTLYETFPSCTPMMEAIIKIAGNEKRGPDDVFGSRKKLAQFFTDIKALCVEQSQVLDQHKPLLSSILDRIKKSQLSTDAYPYIGAKKGDGFRPRRVVVFYIGGATYYEMRVASQCTDLDVVVGGTTVHSTNSFIKNEVQPFCKAT